ncbi:hypothetical protein LZ654_20305 [Lelliottia amnigena]|uniref:hypothetical protein n=1 Tax=Lelliottia amnigena TaxID=61646 RepID=UPI001F303CB6|nr:hypothetical protein [Lelliottia amnigena]MCE9967152.1 hypothetical protein [Lelliottia amnigena]
MPRLPDINAAFVSAVQLSHKGYRYLHTDDFIRELRNANWHFSQADANQWIEHNQTDFCDKTPDFSQNRYWILRNMGRVY